MLIWLIFRPHYRKYVFAFVIAVSAIFVYIQTDSSKEIVRSLAAQVAKVNPRLALLMIGSGEGDLTMDKSWLERKLLVDKGKEIIKDYPVFGIGFGHFKYYQQVVAFLHFIFYSF